MKSFSLYPLAGIDQISNDEALQGRGKAPYLYVRDAVNVNITPTGQAAIRSGARLATAQPYASLWQSPLHGDTFGTLGGQWGRVNVADWSFEPLLEVGPGPVWHGLLNNEVLASTQRGLVRFNGARAQLLAIPVPGAPVLNVVDGSLDAGAYSVCVSWLRDGLESPPSAMGTVTVEQGNGIAATLPWCMEPDVTHARLYITRAGGGVFGRGEDYPIATTSVVLPTLPTIGSPPAFQHMSSMPCGRYLAYWRGRLVVATANVLRFSQAMAYHIHDERHDFVQLPQRITFVQPVDSGLWVGQYDHVLFLRGASPDELALERKQSAPPVPGTAMTAPASMLGELGAGGADGAIWLSRKGYVLGSASGAVQEVHAKRLNAVQGVAGSTALHGMRFVTVVQ